MKWFAVFPPKKFLACSQEMNPLSILILLLLSSWTSADKPFEDSDLQMSVNNEKSTVRIEEIPRLGPKDDPERLQKRWGANEDRSKAPIVELTDDTFEHLTQAASGHTTGPWLVLFMAPWCSHCKDLKRTWQTVAFELKGEVNVAQIDASANYFSATRFNVTHYPTLLLLKEGKYYDYNNDRNRDWRNLVAFSRAEYERFPVKDIRPAHGSFEEIVQDAQDYVERLFSLWENQPKVFYLSAFLGAFLGCLLPYAYIMSAPMDPNFMVIKRRPEGAPELKPDHQPPVAEPLVWDDKSKSAPASTKKDDPKEDQINVVPSVVVVNKTDFVKDEQSPATEPATNSKNSTKKRKNNKTGSTAVATAATKE